MKQLFVFNENKTNKTNCLLKKKRERKTGGILDQINTHVQTFLLLDQPKITIEEMIFSLLVTYSIIYFSS
jgi:hypothetical protein